MSVCKFIMSANRVPYDPKSTPVHKRDLYSGVTAPKNCTKSAYTVCEKIHEFLCICTCSPLHTVRT